jgi:ABC-type branched-subunit amino acid transport system ATPase component
LIWQPRILLLAVVFCQRILGCLQVTQSGRGIFSQLTVEGSLRIGLAVRWPALRDIPSYLHDMFPVVKQMLHRRGGDLSGGQQQPRALARALVVDPKLLILDEPTEGIQPNIVHTLDEIIQRLNREHNLTVLLVEQKLPFARRVASRPTCVGSTKASHVGQGRGADRRTCPRALDGMRTPVGS